MERLLECKEKLIDFYGKYDIYIVPITKFLVTLMMLFAINSTCDPGGITGNPGVILILALVCMFMPKKGILYAVAAFSLISLYSVSFEYTAIAAFVMLIVIFLYMQFAPEYAYMILLSAAACTLNLPVMIAVLAGLFIGPAAVVPVACGTVMFYIFRFVPTYINEISVSDYESGVERLIYIANNVLLNKEMLLVSVCMVVIIIAVYIIRRLQIRNSWKAALFTGVVANVMIMVIGSAVTGVSVNIIEIIIGTIISSIICLIVIFFARNLDYKKIERVQFEDEEYYYYVKAVPKKNSGGRRKTDRRTATDEKLEERDAD